MPAFAAMLRDDATRPDANVSSVGPDVSSTECQRYRRGNFVAFLPVRQLYTPSHAWLEAAPGFGEGRWRVGLTKFATRMLGDIVEVQFTAKPGDSIEPGDIVGSVEGFKALSDLFCVGRGTFIGGNPVLEVGPEVVGREPHAAGWLYEFQGEAGAESMDVAGYCGVLDQTIDRLMASEKQQEEAP
jgi:glycine cleavage system H protein